MKRLVTLFTMLAFISAMVTFNSCKKDEEPAELVLAALTANDADLNAATAPTGVDLDAVITAEFSTDVDVATAVAANITLLREYDDTNVDITISAAGTTITITPSDPLGTGTQYTLTFATGLKSSEGVALAANVSRSFTTEGTFAVPGAIAQWTFENSPNDVVGSFNPTGSGVVDITYSEGRNDASGMAATFNGTTSIIEIPNGDQLEDTDDFTLSFWVYADTTDKTSGYFVLGLGAFHGFQFEIFGGLGGCKLAATYNVGDTATTGEDLWCDATGNLGWQGWVYSKDMSASGGLKALLGNKWAHVVCVYNSSTRQGIMYINGERVKEQDFDLWPDGDKKRAVTGLIYNGTAPEVVNELAFGFIQSRAGTLWDSEPWGGYDQTGANHFKGMLDDIIIYHQPLTAEEILLMYNSGK